MDDLPKSISPRYATALGSRAKNDNAQEIYSRYLKSYTGDDPIIWGFCQRAALNLLRNDPDNWKTYLRTIEKSYAKGHVSKRPWTREMPRQFDNLPLEAAKMIAEHPDLYPNYLVSMAEAVCRKGVASKITPVGIIAKNDKWFN